VLNAASSLGGDLDRLVDRAPSNGSERNRADGALKLRFFCISRYDDTQPCRDS
jgi:hypothetical protein